MKTDNISFGAKFINPINVGKFNGKTYRQVDVSFVEISPFSVNDISALKDIATYWENDKFAGNIYFSAEKIYKTKSQDGIRIFALTTQVDSFEKLDADKILGVIETEKRGERAIHFNDLQAKPDCVYAVQPEYKGIGDAISNSLKKIYNKMTAKSAPDLSVKRFYERNGFVESDKHPNFYTWLRIDKYI